MLLIHYFNKTGEKVEEFSARTDIPVPNIYKYQSGQRTPSFRRIKIILEATSWKVGYDDWDVDEVKLAYDAIKNNSKEAGTLQ